MPTSTPEESIFYAAIQLADPAARDAYLSGVCGPDGRLRGRVNALLSAYGEGEFLEAPAADLAATALLPPIGERPGDAIGPYKLLEQIGEGGMGLVFMAEQTQPLRRRVALKIIKPGLDTRAVIARFEAERQALALMDHPNIARVFDAGATESGRPYFVMELVRGQPISDYCRDRGIGLRDRLELFCHVCDAVQHAHQKGIIHRDLKPTNILVSQSDTAPVPKVIDFGVAKATASQSLTDKTLFTAFSQIVGTPLYMSPEQADLGNQDVDTRSDVYSLGVVLYELLTGTTPFDAERLRSAGHDEMRRIIREEEPPKPSTRATTCAAASASTVNARPLALRRIEASALKGDLDWIVMKALEKDRRRRYVSANELASDVKRYLRDQPIEARPPTASYRLRKYARRHKLVTAVAVASTILVLVAGAGWNIDARKRAHRRTAELARDLAQEKQYHGEFEEAELHYNEAIRLQPDWAGLRADRGFFNAARGQMDAAIQDMNKATELDPENPEYPASLGAFALTLGRWNIAIEACRGALLLNPSDDACWYRYSVMLLFTGHEQAYRQSCSEMLQRFGGTNNLVTADRIAKTCLLTSDAVPDLRQVQRLTDFIGRDVEKRTTAWFVVLSGLAAYRGGDAAQAVERLTSAPLDPQPGNFNGTVYSVLSLAHHKLDEPEQAAACLDRARECLDLWPDVEHGELFDEFGDWLRFRILFDEAKRLVAAHEDQD